MSLPCGRDKCIGKSCGNFSDPDSKFFKPDLKRGCKGGKHPPWSWGKWYIDRFAKESK